MNLLSRHYMEMIMEELQSDNLKRFERKYVLSQNRSWIFRNILSEKKFIKNHNKRRVKSLYFDTLNFSFFRDNIEGVSNRIKPRIRWYEEVVNGKDKEFESILFLSSRRSFETSIQASQIYLALKMQDCFPYIATQNSLFRRLLLSYH